MLVSTLVGSGLGDSRAVSYYNGNRGAVFAFFGPERAVRLAQASIV